MFAPPPGLLGDQEDAVRQQMQMQGLLGLAAGLFQAGTPSRTPVSLGGSALQGLAAGQQAAQGTFDQTLKAMQLRQQMADTKEKKDREKQFRESIAGSYRMVPTAQGVADTQTNIDPSLLEGMSAEQVVAASPMSKVMDRNKALEALAQFGGAEGLAAYISATKPEKPEYLTVEGNVFERTSSGLKPVISSGGKFTGDFANIAVGLYGTANANEILSKNPNAFQEIEAKVLAKAKAGASSLNLPSEGERKAGFLANRVSFGIQQMADVINTNPVAASPEKLPSLVKFLTNSDFLSTNLTSSDRQRIEAAQLDILDAALTLGTGAAYTREQLEGYRKAYFPVLGNDQKTIKDKQDRLEKLLESAYIVAGRSAPTTKPTPIGGAPSVQSSSFPSLSSGEINLVNKYLNPKK